MGRRKGISSDETRRELLDATMRVLQTRGIGGVRVSEIAKEAGITSGSIYNHFSSKAELIAAAISEQAPNAIGELMASGGAFSVIDAFRQIGAQLDNHARTMGPLLLELIVTAARDPEVAEVVVNGFSGKEALTNDVIRLAQNEGEIDPSLDSEALTRFVTLIAFGSLVAGALKLKSIDNTAWAETIDRMLDATRPRDATR